MSAAALADAQVVGTATYRENVELPAGAALEVVLEDISAIDEPPVEISRIVQPDPGAPPFRFSLDYDPEAIAPERRYAVRARVTDGDRVMFSTDAAQPVLTDGAGSAIDVSLRVVDQPADPQGASHITYLGAHGLRLPATFEGVLPCADCDGVRHLLSLWPDQVFQLRREWMGRDGAEDTIGRWTVDPSGPVLRLGRGEETLAFEILGMTQIRLLDPNGAPIDSELNYNLMSNGNLQIADLRLPLRGMVTFAAGAAKFAECRTGREYEMMAGGDMAELEHAYMAAGATPGGAVMASFVGRIAAAPHVTASAAAPVSANGNGRVVLVEDFTGVWPDETCAAQLTSADLVNTYWRISKLGGVDLALEPDLREPFLLLHANDDAFTATIGCNRIGGTYALDGRELRFSQVRSSRMGCLPPLDRWEQDLTRVIEEAARWKMVGKTLELFDHNDAPIAVLRAVYVP